MASVAAAAPEEEPEKNKGGRPKEKVAQVPIEVIAEAALAGANRTHLSKITGLSKHDATAIIKATGHSIEEFREIQRVKLQELMDLSIEQTRASIGKASALQSATVYGIFADKLNNQPNNVTQNLHVHLKESDRDEFLSALLGRQKERVPGKGVSEAKPVTPSPPPADAGPVIDLDPSGSTGTDTLSADKQRK
jgi:hypothetical protein